MKESEVTDLAVAIRMLVPPQQYALVTEEIVAKELHNLLFGERDLWRAYEQKLITLDEAAQATTAHFETWLEDIGGMRSDEPAWNGDAAISVIRTALLNGL